MNRGSTIIAIVLIAIVGIGIFGYSLTVYRPPQVVIDENATFSGFLETEHETRHHSIRIYGNVTSIHFILKCGWSDFDLYGRFDNVPSRTYYDFSGINSGGENFHYGDPEMGILNLMVYSYSGYGHYDLIIEFDYE